MLECEVGSVLELGCGPGILCIRYCYFLWTSMFFFVSPPWIVKLNVLLRIIQAFMYDPDL